MKTELVLKVDDSQASVVVNGKITSHAVGIPVQVVIAGERWTGLHPKLVVSCDGVSKEMAFIENETTLPHECLKNGKKLYIGVDGVNDDGTVRIPTIWAYCGVVYDSVADANPDNANEPTPEMNAQILAAASNAESIAEDALTNANEAVEIASTVLEKANNHEFDGAEGFSPIVSVVNKIDSHVVTIKDSSGDHTFEVYDGIHYDSVVTKVNGKFGDVQLEYDDIINSPAVPTKTSDIENDSGFVSYEYVSGVYATKDSVPNVPAWALNDTKPSYTASEIGVMPMTVMTLADYDSMPIKQDGMLYLIVEG